MHLVLLLLIPALVWPSPSVSAFYLPGSAPKDYAKGDPVAVLVNTVTPSLSVGTTALKSLISFVGFHFPVCL